MKLVFTEHSKFPQDKTVCRYCGKKIADVINDKMVPDFATCHKNGNIPVPNFGWLCSLECAEKLEKEWEIKFDRTADGRIDYYEGYFS